MVPITEVISEVFHPHKNINTITANIVPYNFTMESQTIVVDSLSYDLNTGNPNFTNSNVVGVFANTTITTSGYVVPVSNADGTVNITIPADLYTGPIEPDARANVPINVVSITWTDTGSTPNVTESHRHAQSKIRTQV